MENSELGTLKPCLNPTLNFPPPHRRRPLQSQTYRMFVNILSHCHVQSQDGNGGDKVGERVEENASLVNNNHMDLENSLVQQMAPLNGAKEFDALHDGGSGAVDEVSLLDAMDIVKQGNEGLTRDNIVNRLDSSILKSQSTVVENHKEFSPRAEHKEFDGPFVNEVRDAVNPPMGVDVVAYMPRTVGSSIQNSPASEGNLSEGIEHELKLKQRELEKLVYASGNLDIRIRDSADGENIRDSADGEIEDGEISGEIGVANEAIDLLFEDAVTLEEKKSDEVLVSEDGERELFHRDGGDGRLGKYDVKSSLLLDTIDGGNDIMKLERRSTKEEQNASTTIVGDEVAMNCANEHDTFSETGRTTKQVGGVKETDHPVTSLENLARRGQITYDDITENKDSVIAGMDASVDKKKKRGPLTKERKEKKKRKERIKRAEKNRKLGVKRLKLQPDLKPKKVVYCRHYLRGRCQEGEKCKFSHDTTPLTKSTPCSYFARHACMKGDDCPYDHQLSKYPCNNIVTKGFCSREADCLFSHEISSKDDHLLTSTHSKPELKSPFLTSDSNSKKQVNNEGITNQRVHTKLSALENSSGNVREKKVPAHLERPVSRVPKGICFISHVRSSTDNTSKHEEAAPCLMGNDIVKISTSMVSNLSDSAEKSNEIAKGVRVEKSNEIPKGVPLRTPKGINFLSFGKRPLDDSVNNAQGASESLIGQLRKNVLASLSPKSDGGIKIDNQTGKTSSEFVSDTNKMTNVVSPLPQGMKFLSFGRVPEDNPSAVRQLGIFPKNVNSGPACVQEKENGVDGLKFSFGMPHVSASSSRPLCESLDQSGAGNCGQKSSSCKTPLLLNTPTSVQRALKSTLAFAAKFESEIKLDRPLDTPPGMNRHGSSMSRG